MGVGVYRIWHDKPGYKVKRVYVTSKEPTTKRSNSKKYLEEYISILGGLKEGGAKVVKRDKKEIL